MRLMSPASSMVCKVRTRLRLSMPILGPSLVLGVPFGIDAEQDLPHGHVPPYLAASVL
jgi:hypothetical protein